MASKSKLAETVCPRSIEWMPAEDVGLDSIYVRDASVTCDRGVLLCRMGKDTRGAEPEAQGRFFRRLGLPALGAISGDGTLEGGDVTSDTYPFTANSESESVTISVTFDGGEPRSFNWTSTLSIDAVIAKGGPPGGNVYLYNEASGDTNLEAPSGVGIGHIIFCYDKPGGPPPTE